MVQVTSVTALMTFLATQMAQPVLAWTMFGAGVPAASAPWSTADEVVLHGVSVAADGTLTAPWAGQSWAADMVTTGHAKGKKIHLVISCDSSSQPAMLSAMQNNLTALASNTLAMASQLGVDGICVDYEPLPWDSTVSTHLDAINAYGKAITGHGYITGWCTGEFNSAFPQWTDDRGNIATWDRLYCMSYDMTGPYGNQVVGHNSPLYGETATMPMSCSYDAKFLLDRGCDPKKIFIGSGSYGFAANGPTAPGGSWGTPGTKVGNADAFTYDVIMANRSKFATDTWDSTAHVPYLSNPTPVSITGANNNVYQVTYISYENAQSLADKAAFIRSSGLGGLCLWSWWYSTTFDGLVHTAMDGS